MKIKTFARQVLRLTPAFFLISLISVGLAHAFKVPTERVATVSCVPLMIAFLLTRIAIRFVPHTQPSEEDRAKVASMPLIARVSVSTGIISFVVAVVAVFSSFVYRSIGLGTSASHAVQVTAFAATTTFAMFVIVFFTAAVIVLRASKPLPIRDIVEVKAATFWMLQRAPGALAMIIFGRHGFFIHHQ